MWRRVATLAAKFWRSLQLPSMIPYNHHKIPKDHSTVFQESECSSLLRSFHFMTVLKTGVSAELYACSLVQARSHRSVIIWKPRIPRNILRADMSCYVSSSLSCCVSTTAEFCFCINMLQSAVSVLCTVPPSCLRRDDCYITHVVAKTEM
jgi:hypothetical protein